MKRLRLELEAIAKGEADIVIGTQLVAKGHNFPMMTLVGIVDADLGLANGDPRAAERTFQLLSPGHRPCRTHRTEEPWTVADLPTAASGDAGNRVRRCGCLLRSGDSRAGKGAAAAVRQACLDHRLGRNAGRCGKACPRLCGRQHRGSAASVVLGPAEAPLALIRGRHRFRLLVHGRRNSDMQAFVKAMLANGPKERGSVQVQLDMDPQSFL